MTNDDEWWEGGLFAKPGDVKIDWSMWLQRQATNVKKAPRPMKLVLRAIKSAISEKEPNIFAPEDINEQSFSQRGVYAAGFVDERAIYIGHTTRSFIERIKDRWYRRFRNERTDALQRKVTMRMGDFARNAGWCRLLTQRG
jgi:hypothetical protein